MAIYFLRFESPFASLVYGCSLSMSPLSLIYSIFIPLPSVRGSCFGKQPWLVSGQHPCQLLLLFSKWPPLSPANTCWLLWSSPVFKSLGWYPDLLCFFPHTCRHTVGLIVLDGLPSCILGEGGQRVSWFCFKYCSLGYDLQCNYSIFLRGVRKSEICASTTISILLECSSSFQNHQARLPWSFIFAAWVNWQKVIGASNVFCVCVYVFVCVCVPVYLFGVGRLLLLTALLYT